MITELDAFRRHMRHVSDRELLELVAELAFTTYKEIQKMAVDTSKLAAIVADMNTHVDGIQAALVTLQNNEAVQGDAEAQAAVDSAVALLTPLQAKIDGVIPAVPDPTTGDTGTNTGDPSAPISSSN